MVQGFERRCHSTVNLQFADGRLNLNFDPRARQWNVNTLDTEESKSDALSMAPESLGSIDASKLNILRDKNNQYVKQLKLLKETKERLHIQSMIGKLVVAEGIKDFHE